MAKKQGRKSKGTAKAVSSAGPMAALYHLDAGTRRGDAARAVLAARGVRVKTVTADMLGDPVGAIVGLTGFRHLKKPFNGEAPQVEFMLLHNVTGERLNELLASMREADAVVGCKAQVTQHNRMWSFATLVNEVAREHEAMAGAESSESRREEVL